MEKYCYYCGNAMVSKEHVPPKQMFKGFAYGGFQVPSCAAHNIDKSHTDDAIVKMMIEGLVSSKGKLHEDIKKAIKYAEEYFGRVKKSVKLVEFNGDTTFTLPHISEKHDIDIWIKEISAGIIWSTIRYYEARIKFNNAVIIKSNFVYSSIDVFDIDDAKKQIENNAEKVKILESQRWENGWILRKPGHPLHLYRFLYSISLSEKVFMFKHIFYDNYIYYYLIDIPDDILIKIVRGIRKLLGTK